MGFAQQCRHRDHCRWGRNRCAWLPFLRLSRSANGTGWVAGIVFTLVLKDTVPPHYADGSGREESTVSYETTFSPHAGETVYLPFAGLKATYRGRAKEDAPPVNLAGIRRFSLMVRR